MAAAILRGHLTVQSGCPKQAMTVNQSVCLMQDTASALDAQAMANGLATPSGLQTTNLTEIGEGRRTVVSLNLDRMADSVSGQTVVDPKGYLTDLKSIKVS